MKRHALLYCSSLTVVLCLALPGHLSAQVATNTPPPAATTPAAPPLSSGVAEVVKMFQGGIGKDVLVHYIQNNAMPFHLDADGIIYLQHIGIPQEVITALIQRDGDLQRQAMAAYQAQNPPGAPAPAPPPATAQTPPATTATVATPNTPPPQVAPYPQQVAPYPPGSASTTVVVPDPSVYVYPYYGYPYYYGPGWGWGPGWRGGWGGRGGWRR